MGCNTLTLAGLAKDCKPSMGGIVEVLIANHYDVSSVTVTEGKITAISMAASGKFKKYNFRQGSSSMTSTFTIDKANGVQYVTTELTMLFNRMETTKRIEITALSINDLACIVKDCNGAYFYLGYDEPVNASAADGQTGTAHSDSNRYSITLQDNSREMPYEVDADIIDSLIG